MEGLFTSESVSEGHPDKIADQISDSILDAYIAKDPSCRVACDTLVKNDIVLVGGEITSKIHVNIEEIVRELIRRIGYDDPALGFDAESFQLILAISKQSTDIAQGVDHAIKKDQGAGDQGMVFGYACDETAVLMPAPILYAHQLVQKLAQLRKTGKIPWLRPDAKSQVTLRYENDKPVEVDSIVISTQHASEIDIKTITEAVQEEVIKPIMPAKWLTQNTRYFINPTGRFVIGGPLSDCGLTGRKIVVDTYGSMARDGGGGFSGKDPSKVDRFGAYVARYIAKNIVAAGLATRIEIQISYAIGIPNPLAMHIETFGTGMIEDHKLLHLINEHFDLTPYSITNSLNLLRPIYLTTAAYGHFGRTGPEFTWEKTDKAEILKEVAQII